MKNFWDERFSSEEYIYGTKPNEFLKEQISKLEPGTILLPAEGEGRNAIYAAQLGWEVTAFDTSKAAKQKANMLAEQNNVDIKYLIADLETFELDKGLFDCIALIYVHTPKEIGKLIHKNILNYLKPGGIILLEGFSKKQINYETGGPKNIDMLFSIEDLKNDFSTLKNNHIDEIEVQLNEGQFHKGTASVIRMLGQR